MANKKVIKFYANWCGPCKIYAKTWDKVAEELSSDTVEFLNINVEEDTTGLAAKYKIRSIPLTVIEVDDTFLAQKSGQLKRDDLIEFINQ
jgi:thiol-disulfide isomerase/thioredoxin|tara:strand:+ start:5596 stop:5865 length:270 start_codon:yes stop_codon:yes gene_type:complete